MSEYDLVCDGCRKPLDPTDGVVSWNASDGAERSFALTHTACVPSGATHRAEVRGLVWPNGFLAFVGERFGKRIADPDPLRAIVSALAPFVMRHDNPSEMDSMRAASFGQRLGVKPGTQPTTASPPQPHEVESGK